MADDCEKELTWRTYRRTGPARSVRISKAPPNAPEPRKSLAEAASNVEGKVDDDMKNRNAEPEPTCEPCDRVSVRSRIETYISYGYSHWREEYELQDDNGNTVTGVGLYTARADIDVEMTVFTKVCGPSSYGDKPLSLRGFSFEVPAETLARLDYALFMEAAGKDPKALAALGVGSSKKPGKPRKV
jgi:hypothetical protein